jgi:hypothetical protein
VAGAVTPFWPRWLPWLLFDQDLPEVDSWPPNFVFVALESPEALHKAGSEPTAASLEVLRIDSVSYANLSPEPEVASLLALPDGSFFAQNLRAAGYATAAIGPFPERLLELGIDEVDESAGGRRLLEGSAAWMASAPLLLGPGTDPLRLLGDDRLRSVEQLCDEAVSWILSWRAMRAPTPFLLFVDLRTPDAGAEVLDAGLQRILDRLGDLQLDSVTLLVMAVERRTSGASSASLQALVVPPSSWPRAPRLEVAAQVWGRALSQSLLQIALSDGQRPVRLAGLNQEFTPAQLP